MNLNTLYFKAKTDGKIEPDLFKAVIDYSEIADNPRDPYFQTNLGTIVMKPWNNRTAAGLGDVQVEDWRDYFKEELSEQERFYSEWDMKVRLPTVEECRQNPKLERYIAGTEQTGFHFDKDLFYQDMEADLSAIREENDNEIEDIDCGIPVREDDQNKLEDFIVFNLKSKQQNNSINEENGFTFIVNQITSFVDETKMEIIDENRHQYSTFDDMTDYQLFQKWNEKNLVCLPITGHEHSGITLHSSERDVAHQEVHEKYSYGGSYDNDEIKEDGFIFVDKNNKEVLAMQTGKAVDSDGNVYAEFEAKNFEDTKTWAAGILNAEVEEYSRYVEGMVFDVTLEKFNPDILEYEEFEVCPTAYTDNVERWLQDWIGKIFDSYIDMESAKKIETTINPGFKNNTWKTFIEEVKKELPNFDGNVKHASSAVLYAMNKNGSSVLEKEALKQVMSEKGFNSEEKTIELLNKELGIKEKTVEKPLMSIRDENLKAYYTIINNPNRSDNGAMGKLLLVDEKNKQFILYNSTSYIIDKKDVYSTEQKKLSGKALENKALELKNYGFTFGTSEREYYRNYEAKEKYFNKYLEKGREKE